MIIKNYYQIKMKHVLGIFILYCLLLMNYVTFDYSREIIYYPPGQFRGY